MLGIVGMELRFAASEHLDGRGPLALRVTAVCGVCRHDGEDWIWLEGTTSWTDGRKIGTRYALVKLWAVLDRLTAAQAGRT